MSLPDEAFFQACCEGNNAYIEGFESQQDEFDMKREFNFSTNIFSGPVTCLLAATLAGHVSTVRLLIKVFHAPVTKGTTVHGLTPLHAASMIRSLELSRLFIEAGAHLNQEDRHRNTALHIASQHSPDIVKLLVDHGANLSHPNREKWTGFHVACEHSQLDVIRLMVALGANPLASSKAGESPISMAMERNLVDVLTLLEDYQERWLARQADLATVEWIEEKLFYEIKHGFHYQATLLLDNDDLNLQWQNSKENNFSFFHQAVDIEDDVMVNILIEKRANPFLRDDFGLNAVGLARRKGNPDILRLVDTYASSEVFIPVEVVEDTSNMNEELMDSLWRACLKSYQDSNKGEVEVLLKDTGFSPNWHNPDENLFTILHAGSYGDNPEICAMLVNAGCDPNAIDNEGNNPLHCAAYMGQMDNIQFFTSECNINPFIRGKDEMRPRQMAQEWNYTEVVNFFEHYEDSYQCYMVSGNDEDDEDDEGGRSQQHPISMLTERERMITEHERILNEHEKVTVAFEFKHEEDQEKIRRLEEEVSNLRKEKEEALAELRAELREKCDRRVEALIAEAECEKQKALAIQRAELEEKHKQRVKLLLLEKEAMRDDEEGRRAQMELFKYQQMMVDGSTHAQL